MLLTRHLGDNRKKKMTLTSSQHNEIVYIVNEIVDIHTVNKSEVEERKRYRDERHCFIREIE